LFVIKKIGQRKTLSSQQKHFPVNEKHFPVKEKFGLVFKKVFFFCCVCFPESGFRKTTFQTFPCLFVIKKKLINKKTFFNKKKI